MSILSGVVSAAVSGLWKIGAIAAVTGAAASSAYLGYQWHAAAGARDTAVIERKNAETSRDAALSDNGELRASIANQNASILTNAAASTAAADKYATAMTALVPMKASIAALAAKINKLAPSTTCEQSLAKQRQAIDGLRGIK